MVNDFENTFIDLKDREEIKFDILQVNCFLTVHKQSYACFDIVMISVNSYILLSQTVAFCYVKASAFCLAGKNVSNRYIRIFQN